MAFASVSWVVLQPYSLCLYLIGTASNSEREQCWLSHRYCFQLKEGAMLVGYLEGRDSARRQLCTRLQQQWLAGFTGVHCSRLHVPGADVGSTPATCAMIVHIPAAAR